jgi:hypothetical protein
MFDYLVVAHNGKCADKLMKPAGVPRTHKLLEVKFGARLRSPTQPVMQLNSLWVLMVVLPDSQPSGAQFDGASVSGVPELAWAANNTSKYAPTTAKGGKTHAAGECWTLVSTAAFGQAHKVPQEAVPPAKAKEVTSLMLRAFERALGRSPNDPPLTPVFSRTQLWGAAVPLNGLKTDKGKEFAFEAAANVGVCGDWLSPTGLGVSIEVTSKQM